MADTTDWEIDANGLYVATRSSLCGVVSVAPTSAATALTSTGATPRHGNPS